MKRQRAVPVAATLPVAVCLCLGLSLGAAVPALAQWSTDPAVNTPIAVKPDDQVQPKVHPVPGGGWYVSWYDNDPSSGSPPGGYDVFLQRLDAAGNAQWAAGGLRIADLGFSSTEDYGLDVDPSGNALLAFNDDRFTPQAVTVTKISPAGAPLWGAQGIQMSDASTDKHTPKVTATGDGAVVVAWNSGRNIKLHRMTAGGATEWDRTFTAPANRTFYLADLHEADAGGVIFSWVRVDGSSNRHLVALKYTAAGAPAAGWPATGGLVIFDGGSLQMGNFPPFVPDGSGGAAFGWYDLSQQCYAQHVTSAGVEAFGHNGSAASTNATATRTGPSVAFDPATGATLLFWVEQSFGQQGVYGQRFNAAGVRQWTDGGAVVRPVAALTVMDVRAVQAGGDSQVLWIDETGFNQDQLFGARVDAGGKRTCATFLVSSAPITKTDPDAAREAAFGVIVVAWQNGTFGAGDVYAQNINADCTLGGNGGGPKPGEVSPPGAAQPLRFTDRVTLAWEPKEASGSDTFNLYRGDVAALPSHEYGSCLQSGLTTNGTTDTALPLPAASYEYLVSGRNAAGEGPLGTDSAGTPRVPAGACP